MIKHNLSILVLNHLKNNLHKQYIHIQRIHPGVHIISSLNILTFHLSCLHTKRKTETIFFFFAFTD